MPLIRNARPDDLDKLAAVERSATSMFRDVGLAWIDDGNTMDPAELDTLCRNGTLWVAADEQDHPVGFLAAHELDGYFYIAELSVTRSHQRQGLGSRLMAAAEEHARARGFPAITLTTYRDLVWNGPYYARLGFVEVDPGQERPQHRKKLQAETEAGHDPARRCIMAKALR